MMESRNSYGYGYVGSDKKGFEWRLVDEFGPLRSGYVYKTEAAALRAGKKFCKESKVRGKNGTLEAVPAEPRRFEY